MAYEGSSRPIHNMATPEQLAPYEAAFAPFAAEAFRVADEVTALREEYGLDPMGRQDSAPVWALNDYSYLRDGGVINGHRRRTPDHFRDRGIEGFIGEGSDKWVVEIPGPDDGFYVVKGMRIDALPDPRDEGLTDQEVLRAKLLRSAAPLIRGAGEEGLEQLVAVDLERNLMITRSEHSLRPVMDMKAREIMTKIGRRQVEGLARLRQRMQELGLHPHNAGSILFGKTDFFIVDYTIDGADDNNQGSVATTRELIGYALENHRMADQAARVHANGGRAVQEEAFGVRSAWRNVLMRMADAADRKLAA